MASLSADAKQYVSNNLEIGKLYYFRVRCANAVGFSPYSNEIVVGLNVGMDGQVQQTALQVYPNPAQENINIALFAPYTAAVNLKIIDQIGRVVYQSSEQGQFNNYFKTIPIGQFANGVYQVVLKTNENQWVTKFVK